MNILITNAYVRENAGDAALLSVLIKQLESVFPSATISISSLENPVEHPKFGKWQNLGSFRLYANNMEISRPLRIGRKAFVLFVAQVWPYLGSNLRKYILTKLPSGAGLELQAIDDADMVVSTSGGYILGEDSINGYLHLRFVLAPLTIAAKLNKVVILAPQSYGPLVRRSQKRIVRNSLNRFDLVLVREDNSMNLLKVIGVKKDLLVRAVDSGFSHFKLQKFIKKASTSKASIAITARQWFPAQETQNAYEEALAKFITSAEKKYHIHSKLVPQVTALRKEDDDRVAEGRIMRIAKKYGGYPTQITDELSTEQLRNTYAESSYLIGTRFHSVIFSLSSFIPCIAIEYVPKASGIMHDLDLDKWVIKIEDVTSERLMALFDQLVEEREAYVNHLVQVLPAYIEKTNEVPKLIKQVYEKHSSTSHS